MVSSGKMTQGSASRPSVPPANPWSNACCAMPVHKLARIRKHVRSEYSYARFIVLDLCSPQLAGQEAAIGVLNVPGPTALRRVQAMASPRAARRVRPSNAGLLAAYRLRPLEPFVPPKEKQLTIAPSSDETRFSCSATRRASCRSSRGRMRCRRFPATPRSRHS